MDAFNDELESFKDRIRRRAQTKLEEAMRQVEEVSLCGLPVTDAVTCMTMKTEADLKQQLF
jgi:hypothetical protein